MNSRLRRYNTIISMPIIVILMVLVFQEIIPSIVLIVLFILDFTFTLFVLPFIEVRGINGEYNKSFTDSSLTELTINLDYRDRSGFAEENCVFISEVRKFHPRKQVNFIIFTFVFATIGLLTLLLSLILETGIPIEMIIALSVSIGSFLILGLVWLLKIIKKPLTIDNFGIKTFFRENFTFNSKGVEEKILFEDISEINIKKNKYIYFKDRGVIFEFVMNDGSFKLLNTQVFSDKQRKEIEELLCILS
ncbi:hypothetical protein RJI07_03620 [Mycoplasmatota bacterium WC30]